MITKEILELINCKIKSVTLQLILIGLSFFILAAAILFYPQVLQYFFMLAFFIISFSAFLIAIKINHIKQIFNKALLVFPKKSRGKK